MSKVETINYQGKDYATVPVRLSEYRSKNPKSDVRSTPHWHDDGSLDFETNIIRDKSDESSMTSNGWAHYSAKEMAAKKSFEKLETISIGRALAKQGYLNNGEIATTEEMDEFLNYKSDLQEQIKLETIEKLESSKSLDELRAAFTGSGELQRDEDVVKAKNDMKAKLSDIPGFEGTKDNLDKLKVERK